jgi:hypothetical protein
MYPERFNSDKHGSSRLLSSRVVANSSHEIVKVTTLDDFVVDNKIAQVDFIKADIEGAERALLTGARNTLKKFAPKLAICTYHLPDDPQVLEHLVLDANPHYMIKHKYQKMYAYVRGR